MMNTSGIYSPAEREAIAGWLRDGLSAGRIASEFIQKFKRYVSRNAIIGVVHRNPELRQIGLPGRPDLPVAGTSKDGRGRVQKVRAAKAQRILVAKPATPAKPIATVVPALVAVEVVPDRSEILAGHRAYDAASHRLTLAELERRDCRFAVNDAAPGEEHLFCGHRAAPDSPYCAHHTARAFNGTVSEAWRRRNGKGEFRLKGISEARRATAGQ